MVKCNSCDSDIKQKDSVLSCSRPTCKLQYHLACVPNKQGNSSSTWVCPACKIKQTRRGDNSDTPVKTTCSEEEFVNTKSRSRNPPAVSGSGSVDDEKPYDILGTIRTELEQVFRRELPNFLAKVTDSVSKALESKFLELEKTVRTVSDLYDGIKTTVEKSTSSVKKLQTENKSLNDQIKMLQTKLNNMEEASLRQEQWSRLQNIEIVGVPEAKDESLPDILNKIVKHLNVPLDPHEMDFIHRIQAKRQVKGQPRSLVIRFQNRNKRDAILSAARKCGGITSRDIGMQGELKNIYINEHLTIHNKQLLSSCKKTAKTNNYKFVWTKNCRIYTRKAENSPYLLISCEDDLKKII
ncbi:unnamed protein product [Diatraea saccharalis]|uniref:PHD-type domain-containing protein n=1 Tax=Diatraea saccharalis TaxID=40085 RepID=A0A9N9WAS6_9NEOP|nr:unnamed protein product [Diatraea saccharalis]